MASVSAPAAAAGLRSMPLPTEYRAVFSFLGSNKLLYFRTVLRLSSKMQKVLRVLLVDMDGHLLLYNTEGEAKRKIYLSREVTAVHADATSIVFHVAHEQDLAVELHPTRTNSPDATLRRLLQVVSAFLPPDISISKAPKAFEMIRQLSAKKARKEYQESLKQSPLDSNTPADGVPDGGDDDGAWDLTTMRARRDSLSHSLSKRGSVDVSATSPGGSNSERWSKLIGSPVPGAGDTRSRSSSRWLEEGEEGASTGCRSPRGRNSLLFGGSYTDPLGDSSSSPFFNPGASVGSTGDGGRRTLPPSRGTSNKLQQQQQPSGPRGSVDFSTSYHPTGGGGGGRVRSDSNTSHQQRLFESSLPPPFLSIPHHHQQQGEGGNPMTTATTTSEVVNGKSTSKAQYFQGIARQRPAGGSSLEPTLDDGESEEEHRQRVEIEMENVELAASLEEYAAMIAQREAAVEALEQASKNALKSQSAEVTLASLVLLICRNQLMKADVALEGEHQLKRSPSFTRCRSIHDGLQVFPIPQEVLSSLSRPYNKATIDML